MSSGDGKGAFTFGEGFAVQIVASNKLLKNNWKINCAHK
jgi:hypothetical protein